MYLICMNSPSDCSCEGCDHINLPALNKCFFIAKNARFKFNLNLNEILNEFLPIKGKNKTVMKNGNLNLI